MPKFTRSNINSATASDYIEKNEEFSPESQTNTTSQETGNNDHININSTSPSDSVQFNTVNHKPKIVVKTNKLANKNLNFEPYFISRKTIKHNYNKNETNINDKYSHNTRDVQLNSNNIINRNEKTIALPSQTYNFAEIFEEVQNHVIKRFKLDDSNQTNLLVIAESQTLPQCTSTVKQNIIDSLNCAPILSALQPKEGKVNSKFDEIGFKTKKLEAKNMNFRIPKNSVDTNVKLSEHNSQDERIVYYNKLGWLVCPRNRCIQFKKEDFMKKCNCYCTKDKSQSNSRWGIVHDVALFDQFLFSSRKTLNYTRDFVASKFLLKALGQAQSAGIINGMLTGIGINVKKGEKKRFNLVFYSKLGWNTCSKKCCRLRKINLNEHESVKCTKDKRHKQPKVNTSSNNDKNSYVRFCASSCRLNYVPALNQCLENKPVVFKNRKKKKTIFNKEEIVKNIKRKKESLKHLIFCHKNKFLECNKNYCIYPVVHRVQKNFEVLECSKDKLCVLRSWNQEILFNIDRVKEIVAENKERIGVYMFSITNTLVDAIFSDAKANLGKTNVKGIGYYAFSNGCKRNIGIHSKIGWLHCQNGCCYTERKSNDRTGNTIKCVSGECYVSKYENINQSGEKNINYISIPYFFRCLNKLTVYLKRKYRPFILNKKIRRKKNIDKL